MTGPVSPTWCSWLPRMKTEQGADRAGREQETKEHGWSGCDWRFWGQDPSGGFCDPCGWRVRPLLLRLPGTCIAPSSLDGPVGSGGPLLLIMPPTSMPEPSPQIDLWMNSFHMWHYGRCFKPQIFAKFYVRFKEQSIKMN